MNKGDIYKITNTTNGKIYIGQAVQYTGINNNSWGTKGRWNSHVREALSEKKKDHCILLNKAIREFGPEKFNVETLCECHVDQLDELEIKYIEENNSISPNGYNLPRKGLIKDKRKRKHIEDNNLPKYIKARRNPLGQLIGYDIDYPIDGSKRFNKSFCDISNPSNALTRANKKLNKLYKQYPFALTGTKKILDQPKPKKEKDIEATLKKSKQFSNLPSNIHPIIDNNKLIGFAAKGIKDNDGNEYPEKHFTECQTNRWNLDRAKKHIHSLEVKNADEKFVIPDDIISKYGLDPPTRSKRKHSDDGKLPRFVSFVKKGDKTIGFCIAGLTIDGEQYRKHFADQRDTMEEKLKKTLEHLCDIKNKINS